MFVREIMTDRVQTISPDDNLKDVAAKMDDLNIGALPVMEGDRVTGIVTDRDIIIRSVTAGEDPNSTQAKNVMTSPAITCFEDQTIEDAAKLMRQKQVRRLPVLARDQRLVGILSIDDLILEMSDKDLAISVIRSLSEPLKAAS